ncbi:hypothetical protein [Bifidobacterium avesanii]|uniref:Uncharacterized protein n=1 Tax=Bifidobacterium avesanii TaxID=1798157 RepID=A0A7K3TIV0_9BIFI|nr:hypothetical protein [Bifidobacterium avesanii]KAB8287734.1 ABC transporter permease [Bifidobacterium avesanii]NEG78193.1 hypothetical protein [Bifidobacterium avesanii]
MNAPTNVNRNTDQADGRIADPREALGIVKQQSERMDRLFGTFSWAFCLIWGVAYLVAYAVLGAATQAGNGVTAPWALLAFGGILILGIAASAVVAIRGGRGYRSGAANAKRAAIYGWAWALSFGFGLGGLQVFATRFRDILTPDAVASLYNIVAPLIIGALYMVGSALWRDLSQLVVGVVMLVLAFAGSFLGGAAGYFAMSLVGGGAMILVAVWALTLGRRNRTFAALMEGK